MSHQRLRARKLFAKLLLILVGFLIGGIIAEVALRAAGYSYPEFYALDQLRGYALRPWAEGWYRKEGEVYVRINGEGLHDQEHSLSKSPDTVRIAVVGDSYPEGFSVSLEETFWWVMGIVMLAVTTNNDITDNIRALKKTDEIPYFIYQNNQLKLDDSFKNSRTFRWRQSGISRCGRWLRDHSRVVQAIIQGHHGFKTLLASWRARRSEKAQPQLDPTGQNREILREKPDLLSRSEELGTDNLIYLEPANAVWNDAWSVTEDLILEFRNEVKSRGAGFVVVTLSNGPQVLPSPEVREGFKRRFGITDLFYPDDRIKLLCARAGIPVIILVPELQEFAQHNNIFLHGFGEDLGNGHWNATGHRVAGELIAKKICEGGVLK